MTGRVVVLNGASSSGKSTLAAALQDRLVADGSPWIVMATDDTFAKLPPIFMKLDESGGEHAGLGVTFGTEDGELVVQLGPVALALLAAHAAMVGAAARAGINVIVDDVILTEHQWGAWQEHLAGLDVTWVRVDLPLEILEQRERERGDRTIGMARTHVDVVHRLPAYDVEVDTGALGPDEAADVVVGAL